MKKDATISTLTTTSSGSFRSIMKNDVSSTASSGSFRVRSKQGTSAHSKAQEDADDTMKLPFNNENFLDELGFEDANDSLDSSSHASADDEDRSAANGSGGSNDTSSNWTGSGTQTSPRLRRTAIVLFIYAGVALPIIVLVLSRNREVASFESDYDALSKTVIENFAGKLATMINALDYLSIAATSHSLNTKASWPFVTLNDFDLRGAAVLGHASVLTVQFRPLITDTNRAEWEQYTQENIGWFQQAKKRQGRVQSIYDHDENPTPGLEFQDGIAQQIYTAVNETQIPAVLEGPGPFFPGWQVMPLVTDMINLNPFPLDFGPVQAVYESNEAVIGSLRDVVPGEETPISRYYDFALQNFYDDPDIRYTGEPVSAIFYPVFDSFDNNRQLVGVLNSAIFWDSLFQDILPDNSNGIVCVVKNECGGSFTFAIDGNGANYLGPGDLHEKEYDEFVLEYHVEDVTTADSKFQFSGTAVPLNENFCPYELDVYPSDQLHQQHYTSEPPLFALGVLFVFVLVFLVSLTYDCVVQHRMRKIIKSANENKAIVASIFPKGFRDRLFEGGDNELPVFAMGASNKTRLKAMLRPSSKEGKEAENQDTSFLTARPVADLFPHCTVLFADISGFSAWSSERQPEQVFTLLETIFQAFDKIAKRRRVFKVETIGDTYVAVTGLPDPQPDHAIRMARFARECITKVNALTKMLEATLGPDTGDLKMRFGLHSGQVTAGVLRGEKSRFQLFGDTVNTAARMESTGIKNRIQLSHTTAQQLIEDGKENWVVPREGTVKAKGKGVVQTYWMIHRESRDDESVGSQGSFITATSNVSSDYLDGIAAEEVFAADPKEGVWGDQTLFTAPPSSRTAKSQRLVTWLTDIIAHDLRRVAVLRYLTKKDTQEIGNPEAHIDKADMPLDEVVEAFTMPSFNSKAILRPEEIEAIELPYQVLAQLQDFVSRISSWYRTNHFHNFEHASHVTMSAVKLLGRIVTPEGIDYTLGNAEVIAADMHTHTFGITSDPLAQFAITIAALVHDVDHMGVPNAQVAKEVPSLGEKYKHQSIAEQNSIDIAWNLLMEPKYRTLQGFIFQNEKELKRFRKYLVNLVCATDIFNKNMKALRNQRWEKAFNSFDFPYTPSDLSSAGESNKTDSDQATSLKATIVLEHIIQAADVSHTMQHWNVYKKWNERLFQEMFSAYDNGRAEKDPTEGWYKGELWFFDNYIIPLAQKLEECGVFGVSSDECLNYALENRKEWALKGKELVKYWSERYHKRKMLEMDGFTTDGIENLSLEDIDFLLHKLVKKARTYATFKSSEVDGLEIAAKAWYQAFELFEQSRLSGNLSDNPWALAIYSGLFVFLKGGMIQQDPDHNFEVKLAEVFCEETSSNNDVHRLRALAMKCDVLARRGQFDEALETFQELDKKYVIEDHSPRLLQYYGTDRASHVYSQRALWYHVLGDFEKKIECCEYVVDKILPWMEIKNVLNTFELLYPVIRLQKENGKAAEMFDLFESSIMTEFKAQVKKVTLCRPILAPLSMLLRIASRPEAPLESFDDILHYLNNNVESGAIKSFLDKLYSRLGWAPNSIIAELCLLLARRVHSGNAGNDVPQTKSLIQKGLFLAKLVQRRQKGLLGVECAVETNQKILKDLTSMAERLGCSACVEEPFENEATGGAILKTRLGEIRLAIKE